MYASRSARIERFEEHFLGGTLHRRELLKRAAALGLATPMAAGLLAACGGGDDDDDNADVAATPTTAPSASTPTAGSTSGATATAGTGAAATATPSGAAEGEGGVINLVYFSGDNGMGIPIISGGTYSGFIPFLTFDRLIIYSDEAEPLPQLAESWAFSPDGAELSFNLHEAKWHDGEAFSADDVLFTFDMIKDEHTDTPLRSLLRITGGEYVAWQKIDDRTIKIVTPEPSVLLLNNLENVAIIPEHLLAGSSDINTDPFKDAPIGTGPFKLVEWQRDQFIRYERFDDYFQGRPKADGFTCQFLADTDAGLAALEAGELDTMIATDAAIVRVEGSDRFRVVDTIDTYPQTLAFHQKNPILADVAVRRAVALAIDKQAIADTATVGRGQPVDHQFTPGAVFDQFNDYARVTATTPNIDEANRILDEGGYTIGGGGIRETPDGRRFSFNCISASGFGTETVQVILQEALRAIGIDLQLQTMASDQMVIMLSDPDADPETAALLVDAWPTPLWTDPDMYGRLHSDSFPPGENWMYFADAEIDQLIVDGRLSTDFEKRVGLYRDLDVRRAETLPAVPLFAGKSGQIVSAKVRNVNWETPNFILYRLYSFWTWWKED